MEGLTENILGVFQSVGSVTSMLAAISYTVLERKFGVQTAAFIGLAVRIHIFRAYAPTVPWAVG
jgi:hypothetical protein